MIDRRRLFGRLATLLAAPTVARVLELPSVVVAEAAPVAETIREISLIASPWPASGMIRAGTNTAAHISAGSITADKICAGVIKSVGEVWVNGRRLDDDWCFDPEPTPIEKAGRLLSPP